MLAMSLHSSAQTQDGWTLRQCIDYALEHNITLKKENLQRREAVEDIKQSKAALLPQLSLSTNQSLGYKPWIDNGMSTVNNGMVANKVQKTYYNGMYSLSANWTVWNGNKNRNTIKLNKLSEQQAEADSAATAMGIEENIAQLYVQILYLTEAVEVSKSSLETSRSNEQRGMEMVKVGSMSKADLAQLSAQRAQDEQTVVEAQSSLANYKLQLKQLLEITDEQEFNIAKQAMSDDTALGLIPALRPTYESALAARPEMRSAELGIEAGELSIDIAKAGKLPTIGISGSAGTSSSSMTDKGWGGQIKTNFDLGIGVNVSLPIFDNRQTKTAVNKVRLQLEQRQLDLQEQQKQLWNTIEGYWIDANTSQQKFRAAQTTVDSRQTSYDLLEEQFRLGLKNTVELLTGKDALLQAQQSRLQNKYMTILYINLLQFYSGESLDI